MKVRQQALWILAVRGFGRLRRALKPALHEELGVTSIEYALVASLIAIVALVGITQLSIAVAAMWKVVADAVLGTM